MGAMVYCMCNQKGGCAKSVSSVNLGIGLAHEGKRVLLCSEEDRRAHHRAVFQGHAGRDGFDREKDGTGGHKKQACLPAQDGSGRLYRPSGHGEREGAEQAPAFHI